MEREEEGLRRQEGVRRGAERTIKKGSMETEEDKDEEQSAAAARPTLKRRTVADEAI